MIWEDSRRFDKKRGLENNLEVDAIKSFIELGCSYCGEMTLRITLDRINNNLGHTLENVVPACYRCNLIRGSMPYEAWLHIAPAIRSAREQGLFGDWIGGIRKVLQVMEESGSIELLALRPPRISNPFREPTLALSADGG